MILFFIIYLVVNQLFVRGVFLCLEGKTGVFNEEHDSTGRFGIVTGDW